MVLAATHQGHMIHLAAMVTAGSRGSSRAARCTLSGMPRALTDSGDADHARVDRQQWIVEASSTEPPRRGAGAPFSWRRFDRNFVAGPTIQRRIGRPDS
jgi:hypothetical protein